MRTAKLGLICVCLLAGLPAIGRAQPPAPAELAVDLVTPKRGPRLLGAVLDRAPDGTLTLAVARGWLKKSHATFYAEADAAQRVERKKALEELRDRLVPWIERRPEPAGLAFFLQKESERIAKALAAGDDPSVEDGEFLLYRFRPPELERVQIQPAERKRIALLAWRERIADVEARPTSSLLKELQKLKLDPTKEQVDLFDRLPVRRQSDAEWTARQALVEYQLRQPLDFQGTGNLLLPAGEGAKAPPAGELLGAIFQEQLTSQLAGLLDDTGGAAKKPDPNAGLESASRTAERDGVAGFRVTRVTPDVAAGRVGVEARFIARLPGGRWETVWRHDEALDVARADKDRIERIAQDPQVKQALELVKGTGLGAVGQEQLQSALRMGAATMQVQQETDSRFFSFRDRYLSRLEGPPLILVEAVAR